MKVKELIAELQKLDPELEVSTEGCDCYGDTAKVSVQHEGGETYVLIERSELTHIIGD